jgi:NAD(P)-dependent dehydrogenase (short-subunit alcohol dehydrogenase family)
VFCIDNQEDLAKEVAEEIGGVAWAADARDRAEVEASVEAAVRELGRVHGLVDIVGMARYSPLLETTDEDYDWTFDMVLRHAYLYSQATGKAMRDAGGGCLTFVASVSGITSAPRHAAYGAAKAGLMSWVRSLAVELGPSGVRANAVAPGVVWTPRVGGMLGERGRELQSKNAPLGRVAETADIAAAILFLCSDLASYVTGHTLVVDGGVSAKFPYPMEL